MATERNTPPPQQHLPWLTIHSGKRRRFVVYATQKNSPHSAQSPDAELQHSSWSWSWYERMLRADHLISSLSVSVCIHICWSYCTTKTMQKCDELRLQLQLECNGKAISTLFNSKKGVRLVYRDDGNKAGRDVSKVMSQIPLMLTEQCLCHEQLSMQNSYRNGKRYEPKNCS